ncbi:MAG: hypothetical protein ACREBR_01680 [bacterium]
MPNGGDSCLPNHHSRNAGAHYHVGCIGMPTHLGFYVRLPPSRESFIAARRFPLSARYRFMSASRELEFSTFGFDRIWSEILATIVEIFRLEGMTFAEIGSKKKSLLNWLLFAKFEVSGGSANVVAGKEQFQESQWLMWYNTQTF